MAAGITAPEPAPRDRGDADHRGTSQTDKDVDPGRQSNGTDLACVGLWGRRENPAPISVGPVIRGRFLTMDFDTLIRNRASDRHYLAHRRPPVRARVPQ
jgi:hypothetical protein